MNNFSFLQSLLINNLTILKMCFPTMYRLKSLISIGIVTTLLIGISLLYILVYSFIISSVTAQVQSQFRTLLITLFLSSSLLLIFSSLSGIYGLIRRRNKFVVVYAITIAVYMISFLVLAIFVTKTPGFISSQCETSNENQYNQTFIAAQKTLCRSNCECYFTNTQHFTSDQIINFGIMNYTNNQTADLPINAQNCPSWSNTTYSLTVQAALIESFFNCSGWCQPNPYYLFTNINIGRPQSACVVALSEFLEKFGHIIQITSFTVSFFLMIVILIITCLWLHPDRGLKYDSLEIFKKPLLFVDEQKEQEVELA